MDDGTIVPYEQISNLPAMNIVGRIHRLRKAGKYWLPLRTWEPNHGVHITGAGENQRPPVLRMALNEGMEALPVRPAVKIATV